jgi:hypothetical protein
MPAVASNASRLLPVSTTEKPEFCNAIAAARPIPLPAPVITAILSVMSVPMLPAVPHRYAWEVSENKRYIQSGIYLPYSSESNSPMLMPDRQPAHSTAEPLPIWMAALLASTCHALGHNGARNVEWKCVSGSATYTNTGDDVEILLPFGIPVRSGQTVMVTWQPGESGYTLQFDGADCVAA